VRLLTVLLKLEEDNGGKRKAAHYPQGTPPPERPSLRLARVSVLAEYTMHGDIGHGTGKVNVDGTFLYSLNLLTLILCEGIVPDRDTYSILSVCAACIVRRV